MPSKIKKTSTTHMKRFFSVYLAIFVGLSAFGGGITYERLMHKPCCIESVQAEQETLSLIAPAEGLLDKTIDTSLYWNVWTLIQNKHFERPIEDKALFYGSLEGMVRSLGDPYSVFLKPKVAERFTSDLQGKFYGIGAEIGYRNDRLSIVAPLPETPADIAGLEPGDNIVTINGEDSINMQIEEAVDRIRGEKGTEVVLGIYREGFDEVKDFPIIRGEIIIKSLTFEVEDGINHIRVNQFGADTMKLFGEAIHDGYAQGMRGVILDVRNNPGGFLQTAVQMSSEWIEDGPIVIERFSDGHIEHYMREGKLRLKGMPTVVLVNGGSASASEIVAGALQDYDVATVIGQTTFGKGSVQELEELPDGSALKLTIAKWFTPLDRGIDGEGIAPDIEIKPGDNPEVDAVLAKAKEILNQ